MKLKKNVVKMISMEAAREVVKERFPIGEFVVKTKDVVFGINNRSGDAQVERFKTVEAAERWLML